MVGKKKRNHPDVEEVLSRPWCYYCERDFDDLKILISHQKAKHFKCERCGRRLNTAGGLSVHMNQVHKETLTSVDNSLPNRQGLEVEIFGMEGIPEDVVQAHNQRIIAGFYQAQAERQAATGNPTPGAQGGGPTKKPKFEAPSELKKRLAEHKARKAEQAANGDSGANTPMVDAAQNSPLGNSPASFNASPYPQANFGGQQGAGYGSFSQEPYAQPTAAYQQPFQQPPFSGPPNHQYQPAYSPPQQYPPTQSFPPSFQPQSFPGQYGAGSPPFNGYQGPPSHTPPQLGGLPNRPPSLPPAPGLPARPPLGAPVIPPFQMQAMHQGGGPPGAWNNNAWKGPDNSATSSAYPPPQGYTGDYPTNTAAEAPAGDHIDEMIRLAVAGIKPASKGDTPTPAPALQTSATTYAAPPAPETKTDAAEKPEPEKKSKKDKPIKMIYSDNDLSPEEKMAKMPRYAFVPDGKTESMLVDAETHSGVTVGV